jgi:hypothetical protein
MAKDDAATPTPKAPTQYVLGSDDLKTLLTGFLDAAKGGGTPSAPGLPEAMTALLAQVEKLTQTAQRGNRIENVNYEDVSVFTVDPKCEICKAHGLHVVGDDPIGKKAHPRPPMKYEFDFCDALVRPEWLTIPELELVNQFEHDKTARAGTWTATVSRQGTKHRLRIEVPYRGLDTRQDLPSLSAILVELLYGESIADPAQALILIQQLQQKVNDLEARVAAKV